MIKGKYSIYENGQLVGTFPNVITDKGMTIIRNYLAGNVFAWAGAISVGALNLSAPNTSQTSLEYELLRSEIITSGVNGTEIILSADLDPTFSGRIFELGIYPDVQNERSLGFDDRLITSFSELWTDALGNELSSAAFDGSEDNPTARAGYRSLIINDSGVTALSEIGLDATGYSDLDSVSILYNITSTGSNRTVRVTFYDDQIPTAGTKYYDFVLPGSTTGYKVATAFLGLFTETGEFNGNIASVGVTSSAASAADLNLDSIRFNDSDDSNVDFALISRALIGSVGGSASSDYFEKKAGSEMTIQYSMEIV